MIIALSLFAATISAGGWNRRVYYDALGCKGNLSHGIMVYQSLNCILSNSIVNSACEDKSIENPLSSEGTSCETVASPNDSMYFPPSDQAGKASAYVSINKYTSAQCSEIADGFEQQTYAADGKCYADERGSYFKAVCNGQSATVFTYCKDSSCTECTTQQYDGSCQISQNGLAQRSVCIGHKSDGSSPMGSTTQSGQTSAPTQSKPAQSSAFKNPDQTFLGVLIGLFTAFIL